VALLLRLEKLNFAADNFVFFCSSRCFLTALF
jgi:hypothetical protein